MRVGMIDVDNYQKLDGCFPNIALMKLSAWHKSMGDTVLMAVPTQNYDLVYCSIVVTFAPEYAYPINANKIIRGGSGYAIKMINSKEIYTPEVNLPDEIEHIYCPTFKDCKIIKKGK